MSSCRQSPGSSPQPSSATQNLSADSRQHRPRLPLARLGLRGVPDNFESAFIRVVGSHTRLPTFRRRSSPTGRSSAADIQCARDLADLVAFPTAPAKCGRAAAPFAAHPSPAKLDSSCGTPPSAHRRVWRRPLGATALDRHQAPQTALMPRLL